MKFYLSSMELGNKGPELARLMSKNKKMAYIPNACDYTDLILEKKNKQEKKDIESLEELGLDVEYLDLKDYFNKTDDLRNKLDKVGGVYVRGGNTFILRQAMKLSGFDIIFKELIERDDFVYSGYSAGMCVLAPSLRNIQIVDNPNDMPYKEIQETVWEGLGYLDCMIYPHYKSDHPESEDIDKEIEICKKENIPYKTLRDGEVIIIE